VTIVIDIKILKQFVKASASCFVWTSPKPWYAPIIPLLSYLGWRLVYYGSFTCDLESNLEIMFIRLHDHCSVIDIPFLDVESHQTQLALI
jgi:hypothetical protein